MKKLAKILLLLSAVVMIATGCKKLPEFTQGSSSDSGGGGDTPTTGGTLYYRLNGEPEITTSSISISAKYGSEGEITGMWLLVSEKADMPTGYTQYAEIQMNYPEFSVTLTGLEPSTNYFWCINYLENDNSYMTEPVGFTTAESGSGGSGEAPTGAINGLFSVSDTKQIYFSKGNLQYKASTNTWRFAENQWDYVGDESHGNVYENGVKCNNIYISSSYSGWIDLLGWGTSGYNHGAYCYQPYSTSTEFSDYYAYGNADYNLNNQTGKADWGYNAISNGGNMENQWRTLTEDEWKYVFNTRNTTSGIRYGKAQVNGVNGMLILPDDWSNSYYNVNNTNNPSATYSTNIIDSYTWQNNLEAYGAIFLPAAGFREGSHLGYMGEEGDYWTATKYFTEDNAYRVYFYIDLFGSSSYHRYCGHSVRLVQDAE